MSARRVAESVTRDPEDAALASGGSRAGVSPIGSVVAIGDQVVGLFHREDREYRAARGRGNQSTFPDDTAIRYAVRSLIDVLIDPAFLTPSLRQELALISLTSRRVRIVSVIR